MDNLILHENIVSQTNGHLVSNMDGEKVMMSIHSGKYYNLGQVGGRIWELMESPISVKDLIVKLMDEYEVGEAECERQVISFLEMLGKEQLIEVKKELESVE
ncbi:lasso peptide biosynthesis PqqD family chaperone [Paenibacillus tarimensis]